MGKPTKNVPLERDEGDAGSGSGGDWGNGDTGSDTKLGYRAKAEEGSGSGFMSFKRGGLNSYVEQLTRKSSKQLEKNDSGLEKMSASEQPAMEMKDMNATDGALAEQVEAHPMHVHICVSKHMSMHALSLHTPAHCTHVETLVYTLHACHTAGSIFFKKP